MRKMVAGLLRQLVERGLDPRVAKAHLVVEVAEEMVTQCQHEKTQPTLANLKTLVRDIFNLFHERYLALDGLDDVPVMRVVVEPRGEGIRARARRRLLVIQGLARAGEQAARERRPGDDADALGLAQGEHLALLLAVAEAVVVLHRDERREVVGDRII